MTTRVIRIAGNVLIVSGIIFLLGAGSVFGYGELQKYLFERDRPQFSEVVGAEPDELAGLEQESAVIEDEENTLPSVINLPEPTPIPLKDLPPVWIKLPAIGVDSKVVPAKIVSDQWTVPKFYVGHLEGTVNPGKKGNVAMSGHVESIGEGNIFARLGDAKVGDEVSVYTAENVFRYVVKEKKTVLNSDVSVLYPAAQPLLTLITCTGTFSPVTRDYSHRLVIIAALDRITSLPTKPGQQAE